MTQASGEKAEDFFERLQRLFEGLPMSAALALDPAAERIILNRAARAVLDVSPGQNVSISLPADARPAPFRHFVNGREICATEAPLQRAVAENRPVGPVDLTIERWDGKLVHARVIASPVYGAPGEVVGGLALMLNVEMPAAPQHAGDAAAIVGAFEYFDSVVAEALPNVVWVTDAAGAVLYCNRRWFDYTGQSRDQAFAPNGWLEAVHPDDRERVAAEFGDALARQTTYETEYRVLGAGGGPRWFKARGLPTRDLNGEVMTWVGSCTDIDDEKRASELASEREREFRRIAESLPQIVWRSRADSSLNNYVNARWFEYSGMDFDSTGGTGWLGALHPDDHARVVEALHRSMETGRGYDLEYRLRRRDGEYRRFLARSMPLPDADGAITSWVGTCTDIEDEKRSQDALTFIAESSAVLARSLDLRATLDALVKLVVPQFGDCAWVIVYEGGALRTVAMTHDDPARAASVERLLGACFIEAVSEPKAHAACAPFSVEIASETISDFVKPEFREAFAQLGLRTACVVPMQGPHGRIGYVAIASAGASRCDELDMPVLAEMGVRAALAVQNARLYERERRVAALLQAAQLPERLPEIAGVRLSAKYVAASDDAKIGGDWFDAFALPDGRLVLTIGDVMGHGLKSVATMGAMRRSLRGIAAVVQDPAAMLDAASATLRLDGGEEVVTACVAVFDPPTGRLAYASAGHPPPLLRDPEGSTVWLHAPELPLGLRPRDSVRSSSVALRPGSTVVLYTDGLVEIERDILTGERRLLTALDDTAPDDADLASTVVGAIVPTGGSTSDDIAILTLRYDGA